MTMSRCADDNRVANIFGKTVRVILSTIQSKENVHSSVRGKTKIRIKQNVFSSPAHIVRVSRTRPPIP